MLHSQSTPLSNGVGAPASPAPAAALGIAGPTSKTRGARRASFVVAALACVVPACKGPNVLKGMEALGPNPLIQKADIATIGWSIDPDDHVAIAVEGPDGKTFDKGVTGTLVYKTPSGTTKTVPVTPGNQPALFVAAGPKLDPGLTEMDYTLAVDGKPISGTLYLPPGGTAPIVAEAQASVAVPTVAGQHGPHGGVVQVVGGDRLEIASTRGGDIRVYVLDPDLHPVAVGPRKIVLGVVADRPEIVVLEPDPLGLFFVGHWHVHGDPLHITVNESIGGETHVALVGYRPGVAITVGLLAPTLPVVVLDRWGVDDVHVGHGGVFVWGPRWDEDHDRDRDQDRGHDHGHDQDHDRDHDRDHWGAHMNINGNEHGHAKGR
jgi:hypothetical protein